MRSRRFLASLTAAAIGVSGAAIVLPASPAGADGPTRIINTSSGGGRPSWIETESIPDDGNGRRVTVTFLAEHEAGRRITDIFVDNDLRESNQNFDVTPQVYPGPTTNGLETSRVTLTFDPGKSPDFSCPVFGSRTRRVTRNLGFRVIDNTGEQSQLVSTSVTQVEDSQCLASDDYAEMHDQTQSATTAAPGQNVTFQFRADDADSSGNHNHFHQFRWRLRRLNDGFTTGTTNVNPGGNNDNDLITFTTSFPSRGRWVVEAELGTEDGYSQNSGWARLGGVDVNHTAEPSTSISFTTTPASALFPSTPPSINAGTPISAVASVSDPGGAVQVLEWDATANGTFERREYTVPSSGSISHPALSTAERTQTLSSSSGLRNVQARAIDNGALDASDTIRRALTTSASYRVNAIPTASNQTVSTSEDLATSFTLTGADSDNQPAALSYTVLSSPPASAGTLSCASAPACTFTPAPNFNGSTSFTFRTADGPAGNQAWSISNTATVTINVTPVNDAPTADPQTLTTDEDTPLPIALGGSDVEAGTLTFDVVSGPSHGALTGTGSNRTYEPTTDFHGTDSFVFAVTDAGGLAGTATVSITVTPVNDAPVAVDQTLNATEDTPLNISLAAADVDGDTVGFAAPDTPPSNGDVVCVGSACTYTPHADFNGTDSFTFIADDGSGALNSTDTGTITINVAAVNDAPEAVAQTVTLDEDTPVDVTLGASDVDGDPLAFDVVAGPTNGTTNPVGGPVVTYTPNADYFGGDQFDFSASDPGGLSDTATVVLTINPVNDAPTIAPQSFATDEDTPAIVSVTASDPDGDAIGFSVATPPANGTLVGDLPDVGYLPNANFHGTDTFEVTVDDGNGGTAMATMTITVAAVNDRPVANAVTVTTDEDTEAIFTLDGSDVDGDTLDFTVTTTTTNGTLDCVVDVCTYTPDDDVNGGDLAVFEVSDGTLTDSASVSITIAAVNDPPVPVVADVTTNEDTPVAVSLSATDVDGDALTFALAVPPANGTLTGDPPSLVYTPNPNFFGVDSFDYTVSDGTSTRLDQAVITINPVNDAPKAIDASATIGEDASASFTLSATDVDSTTLTYTVDDPPSGSVSCVDADCTYTPAPNFTGVVVFGFQVSDGELTDEGLVTIDVNGENDAPEAPASTEVVTDEDTPLGITLAATDVDGDTLTYEVVAAPTEGALTGTAPDLVYTPDPDFHGADAFQWQASDGNGGSVTSSVLITVQPVNDAPVALPLVVDTDEDTAVSFALLADDVEGDALTFAAGAAGNGTVTCSPAGACTYTPAADFAGIDSFTFTASDPSGASSQATVTITVTAAPMIETRIVAQPVLLTLGPVFRAQLTRADTGAPLPGRLLTFSAGGQLRCQAVTDGNGNAVCGAPLLDLAAVLNGGYDVRYAGDADFAATTGRGPLINLVLRLW